MSLDARRKAPQATTTASTKSGTTPTTKTKKTDAESRTQGPLHSIALMRAYLDHEPKLAPDGSGMPLLRSIFDAAGHASKSINKEVRKDRVVNTRRSWSTVNAEVFKKIFGVPLRGKIARFLVDGIADQILTLAERGFTVKLNNVMSAKKVKRASRRARNPRTNVPVQVPARTTLQLKQARAAKAYFANTAE
jgi:nucleoid DNA-binding protein